MSDSVLYSEENLQALRGLQWLTRVPLRLKAAQEAVSNLSIDAFQASQAKGYRFTTLCSDYGQVQQRWVVFESAVSRQQDLKLLDKQVKKAEAASVSSSPAKTLPSPSTTASVPWSTKN